MSTMTHRIQAEAVPIKPGLIVSSDTAKNPRVKWIKWFVAVGLAIFIAAGALLWRAHVQNAVTYQTVLVERGSIQAKVTATGTLNAVVDVLVSSQLGLGGSTRCEWFTSGITNSRRKMRVEGSLAFSVSI